MTMTKVSCAVCVIFVNFSVLL